MSAALGQGTPGTRRQAQSSSAACRAGSRQRLVTRAGDGTDRCARSPGPLLHHRETQHFFFLLLFLSWGPLCHPGWSQTPGLGDPPASVSQSRLRREPPHPADTRSFRGSNSLDVNPTHPQSLRRGHRSTLRVPPVGQDLHQCGARALPSPALTLQGSEVNRPRLGAATDNQANHRSLQDN